MIRGWFIVTTVFATIILTFFQQTFNFYVNLSMIFCFHLRRLLLCWPFFTHKVSIQFSKAVIILAVALYFLTYRFIFPVLRALKKVSLNLLLLIILNLPVNICLSSISTNFDPWRLQSRIVLSPKKGYQG